MCTMGGVSGVPMNTAINEQAIRRASVMRMRGVDDSATSLPEMVLPAAQLLEVAHPVFRDLDRVFLTDPDTTDSPEAAYLCAAAATWAHAGAQDLVDAVYRLGLGKDGQCIPLHAHNPLLKVDADAYLIRDVDGEVGVLTFRTPEASELGDWLCDVDVDLVSMPDGRGEVHEGFLSNLLPLWDPIVALLADPRTSVRRLYLTGHGVAGALAVLAGARLVSQGRLAPASPTLPRLQGIHTFGQPMVGNPAFAAWVEELAGDVYYRYVYKSDEVTKLPRAFADFQHAGRECCEQDGQWQLRARGGKEPLAALLTIGREGLAMLRGRAQERSMQDTTCRDHCARQYLRVSRNAINRGMLFP